MKNIIKLEHYYSPEELEVHMGVQISNSVTDKIPYRCLLIAAIAGYLTYQGSQALVCKTSYSGSNRTLEESELTTQSRVIRYRPLLTY